MKIIKNMYVYKVLRNKEIDKEGRPGIALDYFGDETLVWLGTSEKVKTAKDDPFILKSGNQVSYFYSRGIQKVKTYSLKTRWKSAETQKQLQLSNDEQKSLISKFSKLTKEKDPYEKIAFLKLENQLLKNENELLKQEKEKLEQQLEFDYEME